MINRGNVQETVFGLFFTMYINSLLYLNVDSDVICFFDDIALTVHPILILKYINLQILHTRCKPLVI